MKTQSIRFIKRFVLFTNVIRVNSEGKMVSEQDQHHVDFGEHHKVVTFDKRTENSVFIEFAESDRIKGTATFDASYVELLGGGGTTGATSGTFGIGAFGELLSLAGINFHVYF